MFSPQIRGFLYGTLATASLISVSSYALGADDGVFGIYFQNMISSATACGSDEVIVGFSGSNNADYGKPKCTTFQTIVKSIILPHLPIEGQAVIGFKADGSPLYGDVNWHKDLAENISYTGAGNVGIGITTPGATLTIAGINDNGIRIDKISGSTYNYMEWLIGGVRSYWNGLDNNGKFTIQSDFNDVILIAPIGGNVGIGTATPSERLQVNGNIIADDPTLANHVATKGYVDSKVGLEQNNCHLINVSGPAGFGMCPIGEYVGGILNWGTQGGINGTSIYCCQP